MALNVNNGVMAFDKQAAAPSLDSSKAQLYAKEVAASPSAELLLHLDDDVVDSGSGHTCTPNDITYATSVAGGAGASGFGKAAYFNGTSSEIMLPDLDLGTDDFTIDFWWYFISSGGGNGCILSTDGGYTTPGGFSIRWRGDYRWIIYQNTGSGSDFAYLPGPFLQLGTLYHVAIVRESGDFRYYLGEAGDVTGSHQATDTGTAYAWGGNGDDWHIGQLKDGASSAYFLRGYIDEFRISKSVLYSGTGTYDLPTAPAGAGGAGATKLFVMDSAGNEVQLGD